MARTYNRDSRGRFAGGGGSSGGSGSSGGKAKAKPKASAKPKAKAKTAAGGGRKRNKSFVTTTGTFATRLKAKQAQKARTKRFSSKATGPGRDAKAEYKKRAGEARKAAKAAKVTSKVDLTDAGFTRRLGRAKAALARAKANYVARGSSIYDKKALSRVQTLQSAVDSLSYARKTVRNATVPKSEIRTTDRSIIDNYNRQLAAVTRKAASTPFGVRKTTAPSLTPSQKAAATRARNKAAKEEAERKRWERSRSR